MDNGFVPKNAIPLDRGNTGAGNSSDSSFVPKNGVPLNDSQSTPDNSSGSLLDLIPNVAGTIGSIAGEAIGTPLDIFSGPGGTMAGGSLGGGLFQGGGKVIENLIEGKNPLQDVGSEAGQGAIWGAVPGISEAKLGAKLFGSAAEKGIGKVATNAATRAGVGFAGGAGTQALSNVEQGNPIDQGDLGAGISSAAFNTLVPGAGTLLQKGIGRLGFGSAGDVLQKVNQEQGSMTGSGKSIAAQLYAKTQPYRDTLSDFIGSAPTGISRNDVNQMIDDAVSKNIGASSNDISDAAQYKTDLQTALDNHLQNYLQQNPEHAHTFLGANADNNLLNKNLLPYIQNENAQIPAAVVNNLMADVQKDTPAASWLHPTTPLTSMKKDLYMSLRNKIGDATGNATAYNQLKDMLQKSSDISNKLTGNYQKQGIGGIVGKLFGSGETGALADYITSVLSKSSLFGKLPVGVGVAIGGLHNPTVSANAVGALNSKFSKQYALPAIQRLMQRGASAAGGQFSSQPASQPYSDAIPMSQ